MRILFASALTVVLAAWVAPALGAQGGRPIHDLLITVEDLDTGKQLPSIHKGETVVIAPGQRVRLRMTGLVGARQEPSTFPSTRFEADSDSHVQVEKINVEVGSIIVSGNRPHRGPGAHTLLYEVLEDDRALDDRLRSGRIYVRVEEPQPLPAAEATPTPTPTPYPPPSITLYADEGFRGRSARVSGDVADLGNTAVGNDRLSSLEVPSGCIVTLYRDAGFQGFASTVDRDLAEMDSTAVGNDAASSLRLRCDEDAGRGRVALYSDAHFRGIEEVFTSGDYDSLVGRGVGNDRASSLRVDPGCQVVLFQDVGFRGRSQVFDYSVSSLEGTVVGNDSVSSLQVHCH